MKKEAAPKSVGGREAGPELDPGSIATVLAWYDQQRLHFPWTESPNAYQVWIAEVMLQQTTRKAVQPYYRRWMSKFPQPRAVAMAAIEDVLRTWEGLGYYRRAHSIHTACLKLLADGQSLPPDDRAYLESLPGIGPYTSAAIMSFAYHQPCAVYDTNVERICQRLDAQPQVSSQRRHRYRQRVQAWLERSGESSRWNNALMQLGQQVCRPGRPLCLQCPLRSSCAAHQDGLADRIPPAKKKTLERRRLQVVFILDQQQRLLLYQRQRGAMVGLWQPPAWEDGEAHPCLALLQQSEQLLPPSVVAPQTVASAGSGSQLAPTLKEEKHFYLNRCDTLKPSLYRLASTPPAPEHHRWFKRSELRSCTMPSSYRRLLTQLERSLLTQ